MLVYLPLIHENSDTQQECKVQFVFLKQAAADVGVQAEGEVVINTDHSLLDVTCKTKI